MVDIFCHFNFCSNTKNYFSTAAAGTEEVTAKKSAENLQNRTCKGTEEILGLVYSSIGKYEILMHYTSLGQPELALYGIWFHHHFLNFLHSS